MSAPGRFSSVARNLEGFFLKADLEAVLAHLSATQVRFEWTEGRLLTRYFQLSFVHSDERRAHPSHNELLCQPASSLHTRY